MLGKGAIFKVSHQEGEFLSEIFIVRKKDGGHRPIINLKNLNKFVPHQHFKMEGSHCLKCLLQNGDYMCKIDLNDAYFSVSLSKESRKWVRFQWKGSLHEFLCLCFGLGPTQWAFTKLLKAPMSMLRRFIIRAIAFLNDISIFGNALEEILVAQDCVIFLLQHLRFAINLKKCVLEPTQEIVSGYD